MTKSTAESIKKYGFEFLSIFVAIFAAFALDNWKEDRKDHLVATKILTEINNGLTKDLEDIKLNEMGHREGLKAAIYVNKLLTDGQVGQDSLMYHYLNLLRDFISMQNVSGYETLKSKGLEILENDTLRSEIISLYEYDFNIVKKLEEDYSELQLHENYYDDFNDAFAPNFKLDKKGALTGINSPLRIPEHQRKILIADLWKIVANRQFMLSFYAGLKEKVVKLQGEIKEELER